MFEFSFKIKYSKLLFTTNLAKFFVGYNLRFHPYLQYIKKFIKNKKINVKNLLMNQKFVGGIGNIYANEILFYCHLNPLKSISKLNDKNILAIIKNTKIVT